MHVSNAWILNASNINIPMPPCDPRKLLQHSSQHQTDYQQLLRNISRLAEHAKNLPIAADDPVVGEETIVGSNVLTSASVAMWTKGTWWNMFVSFELFIISNSRQVEQKKWFWPWWLFWHPNILRQRCHMMASWIRSWLVGVEGSTGPIIQCKIRRVCI